VQNERKIWSVSASLFRLKCGEDLGYLSGRLGVTKSSFVSLLLGQAVADLRKLMDPDI